MKKPNFFIISAPECVTSLAAWLAAHTQIFFVPVNEPIYFTPSLGNNYLRSNAE